MLALDVQIEACYIGHTGGYVDQHYLVLVYYVKTNLLPSIWDESNAFVQNNEDIKDDKEK